MLQIQLPDDWDEHTQEIVKGFIEMALEYITKFIAENQVQTRTLIGLIPGLGDDLAPGLGLNIGDISSIIASVERSILQFPVDIKQETIDKLMKISIELGTGVAQLIADIVKDSLKPKAPAPASSPAAALKTVSAVKPAPSTTSKPGDSNDDDGDEDSTKEAAKIAITTIIPKPLTSKPLQIKNTDDLKSEISTSSPKLRKINQGNMSKLLKI